MDWVYSPDPALERAVARIFERFPPSYESGLPRMAALLQRLGDPHRHLPFVFHAAGTNGKGSTLAFLQALFEAGALRVHKYTSPHLVRFEERIVIGGEMISLPALIALIDEVEAAAAAVPVSFFEFFTCLAFLAFARHPADAVLLETGLGGRLDATNVVPGKNLVSVLTRISFDHMHVLGDTLEKIAAEKAGIIKPPCPAVAVPQDVWRAYQVFHDWRTENTVNGFSYRSPNHTFHLPFPALTGAHQIENAGAAIAALEVSPFAGLLRADILETAMKNVRWPGRLQHVTSGALAALLPPAWELWLDGAHNDSGAAALAAQAEHWRDMPLHLIVALKKTKNGADFFEPLLPHVASVQAVDPARLGAPMLSPDAIIHQLENLGCAVVEKAGSLSDALLTLTRRHATPQRVVIAGSLYLAGRALRENGGL